MTIGKTSAISRPTARAAPVSSALASAKRGLLVVLTDERPDHPDAGDLLAQHAVDPVDRLCMQPELGTICG